MCSIQTRLLAGTEPFVPACLWILGDFWHHKMPREVKVFSGRIWILLCLCEAESRAGADNCALLEERETDRSPWDRLKAGQSTRRNLYCLSSFSKVPFFLLLLSSPSSNGLSELRGFYNEKKWESPARGWSFTDRANIRLWRKPSFSCSEEILQVKNIFFPDRNAEQRAFPVQRALNALSVFTLDGACDGQAHGHGIAVPAGENYFLAPS